MKTRSFLTLLVCAFLTLPFLPARGENLGELLEQVGLGSLIGTWVDEESNVTLTYSWRIKDHALALSVKTGNSATEALIGVDPATGEALHFSVDDKGRVSQGKWSEVDGLATLNISSTNADGEDRKLRITHKIIDNKQLVVGMKNPETDEGGEITLVRKAE